MSSFKEQVAYNKKKVMDIANQESLWGEVVFTYKAYGMTEESFKQNFLSNSEQFVSVVEGTAQRIRKGKVISQTYAGIVALIASRFSMDYKVYSGVCFPPNYKDTPNAQGDRDAIKKANGKHPMFPTHTYIECNGKTYEYYNGYVSGIEKVDVVEV